jgi:hypothetical protein
MHSSAMAWWLVLATASPNEKSRGPTLRNVYLYESRLVTANLVKMWMLSLQVRLEESIFISVVLGSEGCDLLWLCDVYLKVVGVSLGCLVCL